jgi:hypothetical protein
VDDGEATEDEEEERPDYDEEEEEEDDYAPGGGVLGAAYWLGLNVLGWKGWGEWIGGAGQGLPPKEFPIAVVGCGEEVVL